MPDQNTEQHSEKTTDLNDPRAKFVTEVIEELKCLLLHDSTRPQLHSIRISVDMEAGNDEIHCGWRRSFSRA